MSLARRPAARGGSAPAPAGTVAYFSMEVAIDDELPTYSGGLGVLAGDHLRAAADLGLPLVGVTLVYRQGFFRQQLDAEGHQLELDASWDPASRLERTEATVTIAVGGRRVTVGAWRLLVHGAAGTVPVYFLDTDLDGNDPADRAITGRLYTGDPHQRLAQEAVLGLAGPALLSRLGHGEVARFHMNEGHASLVPVGVLIGAEADPGGAPADGTGPAAVVPAAGADPADVDDEQLHALRRRCVFTTHTPVPAGHDRFPLETVGAVLGDDLVKLLDRVGSVEDGWVNMTLLGMALSGFVNGVAQRHGQVSQAMFPQFQVQSITNGIHVPTWAAPSTQRLFDRHLPAWRRDTTPVRYATGIPLGEIATAHAEAKAALCEEVQQRTGVTLDPEALTLGVARRSTPYKRNDLLLSDPDRLRALVAEHGPLQILYSGKSHPLDVPGKDMIHRVVQRAAELAGAVTVVFLPDYGMGLAARLVAGVDVWCNTPVAPHEASGTSGMKAALNGVPSLSVLDGWWVEGHVEGVTGWAVGPDAGHDGGHRVGDPEVDRTDAELLYRALSETVLPLYRHHRDSFTEVRRWAMALNGSFFTTQRMVTEYALRAYGFGAAGPGGVDRRLGPGGSGMPSGERG